jgi:hypothetical protein
MMSNKLLIRVKENPLAFQQGGLDKLSATATP